MDQAQQLRNIVKKLGRPPASPARVLTITSGKGGVGKSNVAVNLAVCLQRMGKRVIIFDADFGLANVEVMFGAVPKYNLRDLIYHGKRIQDIITEGPMEIGFISGGSGISGVNNLSRDQIAFLIRSMKELDDLADVVLIDTGAGIPDSVLEFVVASPEILMVITSEPSSLTDSYSLLKALHRNPNFDRERAGIKVIANKVTGKEDGYQVFEKLDGVVRQFLHGKMEYLGMVPQDAAMERAVRQQSPVTILYPQAKSAKAFDQLAECLVSGQDFALKEPSGIAYVLSNLLMRRA